MNTLLSSIHTAFENEIAQQWLIFLAAFLVSILVFSFIGSILKRQFTKFTAATSATWDDELLSRLQTPSKLLIALIALSISLHFTSHQIKEFVLLHTVLKVGLIFNITWLLHRILSVIFIHPEFPMNLTIATRVLLFTLSRVFLYILCFLISLDTVGITITPILASLGVGSVAVALALQDTLNNLFSGFYVLVDKPVRPNDYIRLQDGTEGSIQRIGWRSTRILTMAGNAIIIPNSKLSTSVVTNFDLPNRETGFSVELMVGNDCSLDEVERLALEAVTELARTHTASVASAAPSVRFTKIDATGITFNVNLRAKHFTDHFALKHEVFKAVHSKLRKEKIALPTTLPFQKN